MAVVKKSVTQLLVDLKTYDNRIERAIQCAFIGIAINGKLNGGHTIESIEPAIKASKQRVEALINNRRKIKEAIVASNATVQVTIDGKTMTVASAIESRSSIQYKKKLLTALKHQHQQAVTNIDRKNAEVRQRLDGLLKDMTDKDSEALQAFTKMYMDTNEARLVDPNDLGKYIEQLEDEIVNFEAAVDIELSRINATTEVDVDFEDTEEE